MVVAGTGAAGEEVPISSFVPMTEVAGRATSTHGG